MVNQDDPFQAPQGYNPFLFYILLLKRFFDTGISLISVVKYAPAAWFGKATFDGDMILASSIAIAFGIVMVIIGWAWHRYKIVNLDIEIGNRFNDFVIEMRKKIDRL